jgi:hypothetical protein
MGRKDLLKDEDERDRKVPASKGRLVLKASTWTCTTDEVAGKPRKRDATILMVRSELL